MPVSPDYAAGLAKEVLGIYSTAEETLLAKIASRLARGIDEPGWADAKLLEIQALRRETESIIAALAAGSDDAIERALRIGYNRGVAGAGADLAASGAELGIAFGRVNEHAVTALVTATQARVESTHLRIRRWATDVYTDVVRQTSAQVITGVETRQQAARRALAQYAKAGVTGFIDKAGRGWDLATYAEMSTRTAAAQATVQGHMDKLMENGLDLVIVSNAPEECALCRPWEGKVLSLSGSGVGRHSADNLRGGSSTVTVTVSATLAQATDAGLFHPNCRHSTSLYQLGITKPIVQTEDPDGDKLRQRQRALERSVRAAKKAELVEKAWENTYAKEHGKLGNPFTAARVKATARRRETQTALREFIEANDRKNLAYRTSLVAR